MTEQPNYKQSRRVKFILGSAAGILTGWMLNKYGKQRVKQLYLNVRNNIKEMQNQWYVDGRKRALDLEEIKYDIDSNID